MYTQLLYLMTISKIKFCEKDVRIMKKKILLPIAFAAAMTVFPVAHAETVNGWTIDNSGNGTAEICAEEAFDGAKALHISEADADIVVSRPMSEIGSAQRKYRVTFYAKGEYNEENIVIGWGKSSSSSNHDVISLMELSHEKIEKSEAENGWTKYTYIVRKKTANNTDFTLTFKNGSGEIYIDDISVEFDSVNDESKDISGYKFVGQGILDGGFENIVTTEIGDDLADYGWNSDQANISGLTAAGGNAVESAARVTYSPNGNKQLYVKFNSLENNEEKALLLTKKVDIADSNFYVTFRMKGAYTPSAIQVSGNNDSRWQALAADSTCSFENYYGSNVTVEKESDGWTKYTVRTGGNGDLLRIKILGGCLGAYIDDLSIENFEGEKITLDNGTFDEIYYDETERFAADWDAQSVNGSAFVQRVVFDKNPAAYIQTKEKVVSFSQKIESDATKEYSVSFETFASKGKNGFKVGFGENAEKFEAVELKNMDKTDLGYGRTRYTFTAKPKGSRLIFVSSGECDGIYIDNVSVKDADVELLSNGDFAEKAKPAAYVAEEYKLYIDNAQVSQISAGACKVAVQIENNYVEPEQEFTLILCHVRDGEMIKYNTVSKKLAPNGQTDEKANLECGINLSDYAEGDSLEVYLWDNASDMNSLRSYCVYGTL